MRARILAVTLALALAPVAAEAAALESNVRFIMGALGWASMPTGTATVLENGVPREVPIAEAVAAAAALAGDVDLASLAHSSGMGQNVAVGDVWILAFGAGGCSGAAVPVARLPPTTLHPQAFTYGEVGTGTFDEPFAIVLDWTTKGTSSGPASGTFSYVGTYDDFCFAFAGLHFRVFAVNGLVAWA